MNGRAYDYNLGRFLSVDPIIQSPTNSQSLNPYSYIMNNPLAGTDPTGYMGCAASKIDTVCANTDANHGGFAEPGTMPSGISAGGAEKGNGTQPSQPTAAVQQVQAADIKSPRSASESSDKKDNENLENATKNGDNDNKAIFHRVTGDNSPHYYKSDGTPVWVTSENQDRRKIENIRVPSKSKYAPTVSDDRGYWREIGRVYGKGSSGKFVGSRKVKLNFFDEQGLAISNGIHFSIDYQQLGKDGKPIPTYSSAIHGQLMKALPMGLTYELYGGDTEKFSWYIKTKSSQASCDNCGAGGIVVSEYVYE